MQRSGTPAAGQLTPRQLENRAAYCFLVPWLIGLLCITAGPLLASLYLAFTRYDILTPPSWIGIDNFVQLFTTDLRFWRSVRVTLTYVAASVPLVLLVSACHSFGWISIGCRVVFCLHKRP